MQNAEANRISYPAMRIILKHGLDLRVGGEPRQRIEPGPAVRQAALLGADYVGLKPALSVRPGDRVRAGDALFTDRRFPAVRYPSPLSGIVAAINRGRKRRLESVVIRREGDDVVTFDRYPVHALAGLSSDEVAAQLHKSGQWTALRSRPFDHVPAPDQRPEWLFITAIDTDPLAPDPGVVIGEHRDAFRAGVIALTRLAVKKSYLCVGATLASPLEQPPAGLEIVEFSGRHPAGLPGTHIHHLARVTGDAAAWHIGYQDVISIGRQFMTGHPWLQRVVALAGPGVRDPRLVTAPLGASLTELLAAERVATRCIVSGPVLGGRRVSADEDYLGRYHRQVVIRPDATEPAPDRRAQSPGLRSQSLFRRVADHIVAAMRGQRTGMVPVEAFDAVWPLQISPVPLLRALLVNDTENAEMLGCLSLAEEDLALCSHVCPAQLNYSTALRATLTAIESQL